MFLIEKMEIFPFSTNERHIVNYLLSEKQSIEGMSTADIAKATYSSKSALVRIAKKLDFSGWVDFKKAFLTELYYLDKLNQSVDANLPFSKQDNLITIANRIAKLKQEAILDTVSLLDNATLEQAVNLLEQAKSIHIFAASNNLLNAQGFQHNMKRIQKDVHVHQLHGEILFDAYLVPKESCALVISYSGETLSLQRVMKLLRRHHIPIILLTSLGENKSTNLTNCILRLATREKLYSKIGTFSTDASITYLLDLLYSGVFAQNYENRLALRIHASQLIEFERTSSSKILNEAEEE